MKTCFMVYMYKDNGLLETAFFEKEGNYSHLNNSNINNIEHGKEVLALIYGDKINKKNNKDWSLIVTELKEPTKNWDYFTIIHYRFWSEKK